MARLTATVDGSYDAIVVGAGMGGIYAVHRLRQVGLEVLGIEGAPDVGGVWYHNCYPGARVDIESDHYCYLFDEQLYKGWQWSERYAGQPELLRYLNRAADHLDVRRNFQFDTWVSQAEWDEDTRSYLISTSNGQTLRARYLVMTTGQLSKPRRPAFPGLDEYKGDWALTSQWPHENVDLAGRTVGIIGTGSSAVQAICALAKQVEHLYVFQRTPNYAMPMYNGPALVEQRERIASDLAGAWRELLTTRAGLFLPDPAGRTTDFSEAERARLMEECWNVAGHQTLIPLFTDISVDWTANAIVSEFVADKVRQTVRDPAVAEKLVPRDYPIGTRRMCPGVGYYEVYNEPNVTLVDIRNTPIESLTARGLRTSSRHYDLDTIVFSLGFNAFTGSLEGANIRNADRVSPSEHWSRGPRTFLGLFSAGFPNCFVITGPGSPSVLVNMNVGNVQQIDFVAELLGDMGDKGYSRVEASTSAEDEWTAHCADLSENLLRRKVDNYMVHVNRDDGTRVFIPYSGGLKQYVDRCDREVADNYPGLVFA